MCDKTSNLEIADQTVVRSRGEQEQRETSNRSRSNVNLITVRVLTVQQVVTLLILILVTVGILQIPTILYYTNQPSLKDGLSIGIDIDFNTCSVSSASCMMY